MKNICKIALILVFAGVHGAPASAQVPEINIMAGPPMSTSLKVVDDIRALGEQCDIDLKVHESSGALDNLLAVKSRQYTQMGVIQSDVLEYLETYQPDVPDIANTMRGIKVAFPMYQQEIQVLTRPDITSLSDLDGKRVAIGDAESGTFLTATVILDLSGLREVERIAQNPDKALPALIAGELDALFFVDGVPSPVFAQDGFDYSQVKLLSIDDPVLAAVYEPATVLAGTYPFVTEDVQTIAVRAVMLAYDYNANRNRYNRSNCAAVTAISRMIAGKIDALRATGHAKWSEVDLEQDLSEWGLTQCSRTGIVSHQPQQCQ